PGVDAQPLLIDRPSWITPAFQPGEERTQFLVELGGTHDAEPVILVQILHLDHQVVPFDHHTTSANDRSERWYSMMPIMSRTPIKMDDSSSGAGSKGPPKMIARNALINGVIGFNPTNVPNVPVSIEGGKITGLMYISNCTPKPTRKLRSRNR